MGILKSAKYYIKRSPYQALAAISIMTLTFLVGGLFCILSIGSSILLHYFEQKPEVIVFFKDTKSITDIKKLEEKLKNLPEVASVKYVSKEEAFEENKKEYADNPLVLEMVPSDILPASLEVTAAKIELLHGIAETLKSEPDIDRIIFPEDVVNILITWTKTFKTIGIILVVFLGITSLLTVMTVISMKIAIRKNEIDILQLVGASAFYIRNPFLLEGAFYGISGSFIGLLVNIGLLLYMTPFLTNQFADVHIFPIPLVFYLILSAAMLGSGFLLGVIASTVALNRYLR